MTEDTLANASLDAMLLCEERGAFRTMRTHIETSAELVIEGVSKERLTEFARLLVRVIKAIDHEAVHGVGTLFNWGHPANIEMIASGIISRPKH